MLNRAYSVLTVKALNEEPDFVVIRGVASTPVTDRLGDIVEPTGARFSLPMPLLWQHDQKQPVGIVTFAQATTNGITFEARLPNVKEAGTLKNRVDEAIQSIKYRLIAGVSIGFKEALAKVERMKGGGLRFMEYTWLELSLVTIPANSEATITTIKSIDTQQRTASGAGVEHNPGVSGSAAKGGVYLIPKGSKVKISEQLSTFETKRTQATDRLSAIMEKSSEEGRTLDESEVEEYDHLQADLRAIDSHVARLKAHETIMVAKATAVSSDAGRSVDLRGGQPISVRRNLPPGVPFTRYALTIAQARGNLMQAEVLAKRFDESSPEVSLAIKAAVAAGTTQDATWAAPLVQLQEMQSEFVAFMRPMMLIGQLEGLLRRVPFNIKFTRQTAGTTGTFVGEGLPKPLGKMDFELLSLTWAKAATIIVMTEELVRFSSPAAETLARDDLAAGIAQYLDRRFIDPSYAGVANVSPASITNGAPGALSTGTTIAAIDVDVETAVARFITADIPVGGLVWIMNPRTALSLSMKRHTDGNRAFPEVSAAGGTFMGYRVIVSNNVALAGSPTDSFAVLIAPSEIMLADDGAVTIDMSTEASLQMSDTPSGGATSLVSLWQNNLVGLRAERFINWRLRRAAAVSVINNVDW